MGHELKKKKKSIPFCKWWCHLLPSKHRPSRLFCSCLPHNLLSRCPEVTAVGWFRAGLGRDSSRTVCDSRRYFDLPSSFWVIVTDGQNSVKCWWDTRWMGIGAGCRCRCRKLLGKRNYVDGVWGLHVTLMQKDSCSPWPSTKFNLPVLQGRGFPLEKYLRISFCVEEHHLLHPSFPSSLSLLWGHSYLLPVYISPIWHNDLLPIILK